MNRAQRSQSVISSVSLQDSQLQFYDAIEYFTSDTESDDDSDQDSDADNNDNISNNANKINTPAIVPGLLFRLLLDCIIFSFSLNFHKFVCNFLYLIVKDY